jgi:hypothetical protein
MDRDTDGTVTVHGERHEQEQRREHKQRQGQRSGQGHIDSKIWGYRCEYKIAEEKK